MRTFRAEMQLKRHGPREHRWPVVAHPWYGGAFPLCTMTLYPSPGREMIEKVLGLRESGQRWYDSTRSHD